MSIHDGHRERMRQRVQEESVMNFQEHEILEVLLYPLVPRKDTNELAHKLVDRFGSFAQTLDADVTELQQVLSESAANYIAMLPDVSRRYNKDKVGNKYKFNSIDAVVKYFSSFMNTLDVEEIHLLCLNNAAELLKHELLQRGVVNQSSLYIREVMERAIKNKASSVIIAHNHPGGAINPSPSDVEITKMLAVGLSIVQIPLFDHIIIGGDKSYSFKRDGNLDDFRVNCMLKINQDLLAESMT